MAAARKTASKNTHAGVIDAAAVRRMVSATSAAAARQPVPFDGRDGPRDRLFALLMQRVDCLQMNRAAYLRVIETLPRQPGLLAALGPTLHDAMCAILRRAGLPDTPAYAAGLGLAYAATVAAWRNDTSADLSKTMKACDRALSLLERVAEFIPDKRH